MIERLHALGGAAVGQTKLAKEAGLADLLCVGVSAAWDADRRREVPRKPAKYPFVNLLAATAFAPDAPRSAAELAALPQQRQGVWYEWTVAQELHRRAALAGVAEPERLPYSHGGDHEIAFALPDGRLLEVRRVPATALEFAWFGKVFPRGRLHRSRASRSSGARSRSCCSAPPGEIARPGGPAHPGGSPHHVERCSAPGGSGTSS